MNRRVALTAAIVILVAAVAGFAAWSFRQNRPTENDLPVPFQTIPTSMKKISIISPAFDDFGAMPAKFTCDGENVSPPLQISDIPAGAKSVALILDDPDAPGGTWVHWVKFNLPIGRQVLLTIEEGKEPSGISGAGTAGNLSYQGPCPPPGAPHRYRFNVYALDTPLPFPEGSSAAELEKAIAGHLLGQGTLTGLYSRAR